MKKAGILTYHYSFNYGAMLQAYALNKTIESLGVSCEIIDYRFPPIYKYYQDLRLSELIIKYGKIGGSLRYIKRYLRGDYSLKSSRNKYIYFRNKKLKLSKTYRSKESLKNLPYDYIVFGSDQIWNPVLTDGTAHEYIGNFLSLSKTKKFSYAASCGSENIPAEYQKEYFEHFKNLTHISVREENFCKNLNKNGLLAVHNIDPTLLLGKKDWLKLLGNYKLDVNLKNKFILVYAFDEDASIYKGIDELAAQTGFDVVVITDKIKPEHSKYIILNNCGPLDFIYLFKNAEKVVTTSFHGTAFSVIFEKDFYCIPHKLYHERTDSLLKLLCLENHNFKDFSKLPKTNKINYEKVNQIINNERNKAIEFLTEALNVKN